MLCSNKARFQNHTGVYSPNSDIVNVKEANQLTHNASTDKVCVCLPAMGQPEEQVGNKHLGEHVDGGAMVSELEKTIQCQCILSHG